MNKNDIKMLSEAYLKIHEDLDKPNFGNLSRSKPERYERIEGQKEIIHHPPEFAKDYDQNAVDYAYRNWIRLDDEQAHEIGEFTETPEEYLKKFPEEIREQYGNLINQYTGMGPYDYPAHNELSYIEDKIIDLLKQYISHPELAEKDFNRWENEVVLGEESDDSEFKESYKSTLKEAKDPYQRDWGDEDMDNGEISSGSDYLDTAMGDLLETLEFADWGNLNPDWAKYMAKHIFIPLAKGKEYIDNADTVYSNLPSAFYQREEEDDEQAENERSVDDAADIFVRELRAVGEINPAWAKIWLDHLFMPMAKGQEVDLDTVRQLLSP